MALQLVKEIDERTKNLVYGYIRIYNQPSIAVPMEICYICLLFYYLIPEKFIKCDDGLNIKSSDKGENKEDDIGELQKIPLLKMGETKWLRVHGNMIIDPILNPNAIISWTIKSKVEFCQIGIHSNYTDEADDDCDYEWYGQSDEKDSFYQGAEIKLELDIPKRKLIFYKNDMLTKIAFDNIDLNKQYHLVVKLHQYNNNNFAKFGPKGEVKLIDFDMKGHEYVAFYHNKQL